MSDTRTNKTAGDWYAALDRRAPQPSLFDQFQPADHEPGAPSDARSSCGSGSVHVCEAGGRPGALSILVPDLVAVHLAGHAPVAFGVSGGKDGETAARLVSKHLDAIGHRGPRLLIHADLGLIEWADSRPSCERLAADLGLELVVVRRPAGGMIPRWRQRWRNNVERYRTLACVKLIMPWSAAAMRFCTSELKSAVIAAELKRRFPGQTILSVSGIRREESPRRAKAPVVRAEPRLEGKTAGTRGFSWNPILDLAVEEVFGFLLSEGATLHEAYTVYGSSRVSCSFCVLGSQSDLRASTSCPDNAAPYRELVSLEAESGFAFQSGHWLGDVAPHLLGERLALRLERAKEIARQRASIEAEVPAHLLYSAGWPQAIPTITEAELLADVRSRVAALYGWSVECTDAVTVVARHEELLSMKYAKDRVKARVSARPLARIAKVA